MREIRAPGDPQDFESATRRLPVLPVNYWVEDDADREITRIVVQDVTNPSDRGRNLTYRVYFLPATATDSTLIGYPLTQRQGFRLAQLVGEIAAPVRSDEIVLETKLFRPVVDGFDGKGWYYVVGVNREGKESLPGPPAKSPWGVA